MSLYDRARHAMASITDAPGFLSTPVPPALLDEMIADAMGSIPERFAEPPWRMVVVVGEEREHLITQVAEALARHWGLGSLGPRGFALVGVFGTNTEVLALAIGVIYVPIIARVMRGATLTVKGADFVDSARALGAPEVSIMLRHVLPNSISPVAVQASILMGIAILIEAALSFIGLGTQPPDPSLGLMLSDGRGIMQEAPWVVIFPGLAIVAAVLGFNLLGDGLRDLLDPRARSR